MPLQQLKNACKNNELDKVLATIRTNNLTFDDANVFLAEDALNEDGDNVLIYAVKQGEKDFIQEFLPHLPETALLSLLTTPTQFNSLVDCLDEESIKAILSNNVSSMSENQITYLAGKLPSETVTMILADYLKSEKFPKFETVFALLRSIESPQQRLKQLEVLAAHRIRSPRTPTSRILYSFLGFAVEGKEPFLKLDDKIFKDISEVDLFKVLLATKNWFALNNYISELKKQERFIPTLEKCIESGSKVLMSSFGEDAEKNDPFINVNLLKALDDDETRVDFIITAIRSNASQDSCVWGKTQQDCLYDMLNTISDASLIKHVIDAFLDAGHPLFSQSSYAKFILLLNPEDRYELMMKPVAGYGETSSAYAQSDLKALLIWFIVLPDVDLQKIDRTNMPADQNLLHMALTIKNDTECKATLEQIFKMYSKNENLCAPLQVDDNGNTPLYVALIKRDYQIFEEIRKDFYISEDITISNKDGNNGLHLAAQRADDRFLREVMFDYEGVRNDCDNDDSQLFSELNINKETPCHLMVENKHYADLVSLGPWHTPEHAGSVRDILFRSENKIDLTAMIEECKSGIMEDGFSYLKPILYFKIRS